MEKREARVYYLQEREDRKAIIVFDAGYAGGDVHIYEHKEAFPTKEIKKEIGAYLKLESMSKETEKEIVRLWVEKRFGHSISWNLLPE